MNALSNPYVVVSARQKGNTDIVRKDVRQSSAYDVVCIGSSAGGLSALTSVLPKFPPDFPAIVLVVQHLDPRVISRLSDILARRSAIKIVEAIDGDELQKGLVMIAPPDRHMLIEEGHIRLTKTELVHFVRPSVDLLFESAAAAYDGRVIGVILTGSGLDGALGIRAVKKTGGFTLVQDPETAENTGMPQAAISTGVVNCILPLSEIGDAIVNLVLTGNTAVRKK